MNRSIIKYATIPALSFLVVIALTSMKPKPEWVQLFDGKSLNGWKVNERPQSFRIEDGSIVANGDRAHLFYTGPVADHNFTTFTLKLSIMTTPGSNSGVYIHTRYQDDGWPSAGYEIQVNNSHGDWRRTGSVYGIQDVKEAPAPDNKWFVETISVEGRHIVIKVDGKVINDYTAPENNKLAGGTFALQAHDPGSKVYYKDIMVSLSPNAE